MNWLSDIAKWLQKLLDLIIQTTSPQEGEAMDKEATTSPTAEKSAAEEQKEPKPPLKQRLKAHLKNRWAWLRARPRVAVVFAILIAVIIVAEYFGLPSWLGTVWAWLGTVWTNYKITILVVTLVPLAFIVGSGWLYVWRWIKLHRRLSILATLVFISLIYSIYLTVNTWVLSSVEVWSEQQLGHSGEEIAVQFRGNLNAVGVEPFDTLALFVPHTPAIVTQIRGSIIPPLSLDQCPEILLGPDDFDTGGNQPITLPRSSGVNQEQNTTGGDISLNTVVGSFDIPLERFFRFLISYTPNYLDLNAQILPASSQADPQAVRIVVNASDGQRWVVEGPSEHLPQLINFLAHLIALALQNRSNPETAISVDEADLAFYLGNQAFKEGDFVVAEVYYGLAKSFRPDKAVIQTMLGVTQFQLSAVAPAAEAEALQKQALRALRLANALEPKNSDVYPYLACLQKLQEEAEIQQIIAQANAALTPDTFEAIERRIQALEQMSVSTAEAGPEEIETSTVKQEIQQIIAQADAALSPDTVAAIQLRIAALRLESQRIIDEFNATLQTNSPEAIQERLTELGKRPALGPGRHFSLFSYVGTTSVVPTSVVSNVQPTLETTDVVSNVQELFDLYYISGDTISFILRQPYSTELSSTAFQSLLLPRGDTPRQIFAVAKGAYYLTAEGLVYFFWSNAFNDEHLPVIKADDLQFQIPLTLEQVYTGGIRQIFAKNDFLFAVGRFGQIIRYRVDKDVETKTLNVTREAFARSEAHQIFLAGNALYILKEDGTVWQIPEPFTGDLQIAHQLVNDTDNREITAAEGVVYMLRLNGNIWRYLDREGVEKSLLIDQGRRTLAIFIVPQGLLVLKEDGQVFLIRNPQEPGPVESLLAATPRLAIGAIGAHLIALESEPESTTLLLKSYPNQLPALLSAAPAPSPTPIPSPTPSPTLTPSLTPSPIPTFTPAPTSTSTPTPDLSPTPTLAPTLPLSPTLTATPILATGPVSTAVLVSTPITPTATLSPTSTPTPTASPGPTATFTPASPTETPAAISPPVTVEVKDSNGQTLFLMDQTEVTNLQYRACMNANVCDQNAQGYAAYFYEDNYPVVGVNFEQATRYCAWQGGRLPTAAEWRAAVSPDGRIYPWGNASPACEVAVIQGCSQLSQPQPVGSKPAGSSLDGVLDLIGNVWEWTSTPGPGKETTYVTVGGSWSNPDGSPQGGFEAFNPPNAPAQGILRQTSNIGFRCVRDYQGNEVTQ